MHLHWAIGPWYQVLVHSRQPWSESTRHLFLLQPHPVMWKWNYSRGRGSQDFIGGNVIPWLISTSQCIHQSVLVPPPNTLSMGQRVANGTTKWDGECIGLVVIVHPWIFCRSEARARLAPILKVNYGGMFVDIRQVEEVGNGFLGWLAGDDHPIGIQHHPDSHWVTH